MTLTPGRLYRVWWGPTGKPYEDRPALCRLVGRHPANPRYWVFERLDGAPEPMIVATVKEIDRELSALEHLAHESE